MTQIKLPLRVEGNRLLGVIVRDADQNIVATLFNVTGDEAVAWAQLFAHAPKLREACRRACEAINRHTLDLTYHMKPEVFDEFVGVGGALACALDATAPAAALFGEQITDDIFTTSPEDTPEPPPQARALIDKLTPRRFAERAAAILDRADRAAFLNEIKSIGLDAIQLLRDMADDPAPPPEEAPIDEADLQQRVGVWTGNWEGAKRTLARLRADGFEIVRVRP